VGGVKGGTRGKGEEEKQQDKGLRRGGRGMKGRGGERAAWRR